MKRTGNLTLHREQLDKKFAQIQSAVLESPKKGWIKAIRESLGMSLDQLGERVHLPRQNINRIEKSETSGHVTVATLRKIADALSCDLHITLVPRDSLQSMIESQASEVARRIIKRTHLHMSLENQQTDTEFVEEQIKKVAEELIRKESKQIWD